MRKVCFVTSCKSKTVSTPNKIFFNVPRTEKLRANWFAIVGKENVPKGSAYYCCEDHFNLSEDVLNWREFQLMDNIKPRLRENVVPHKNIVPYTSEHTDQELAIPGPSKLTGKRRHEIDLFSLDSPQKKLKKVQQPVTMDLTESPSWKSSTSIGTSTDEEIIEAKQSMLALKRRETTYQMIENNSKFYLGLPEDIYILLKIIPKYEKVTYRDVLITLKKIRLDDVYLRLSLDFGISISTVQRAFVSSVPKVANFLRNFIFFPTKQQIQKLLPVTFRYRYSHVHFIIDSFEIEIEKPSNPLIQSHTWSEYKKCNTIKYLVSMIPNGFINFISEGFGGRITDNNIIQASGFLDSINSCGVMADRGFKHVAPLFGEKNCVLVRPPSVGETPLSKQEVKEAKRIAALRIHVERLIRRLREFKILIPHSCVNSKILSSLTHLCPPTSQNLKRSFNVIPSTDIISCYSPLGFANCFYDSLEKKKVYSFEYTGLMCNTFVQVRFTQNEIANLQNFYYIESLKENISNINEGVDY